MRLESVVAAVGVGLTHNVCRGGHLVSKGAIACYLQALTAYILHDHGLTRLLRFAAGKVTTAPLVAVVDR
jgi:hypothetical protein